MRLRKTVRLSLSAAAAVLVAAGCRSKASAQRAVDPNEVMRCSVDAIALEKPAELFLGTVTLSSVNDTPLSEGTTGTVAVEVTRLGQDAPLCHGKGKIDATSFPFRGRPGRVFVALDSDCEQPPQSNVQLVVTFRQDGHPNDIRCRLPSALELPKKLGGSGLDIARRRARDDWQAKLDAHDPAATALMARATELGRVAVAIGDAWAAHPRTACAPSVKGAATLWSYPYLRRAAGAAHGGPDYVVLDVPKSLDDPFPVLLAGALATSPQALGPLVEDLRKQGPYVAVVTVRGYSAEAPLSFDGDVIVVDRANAKVECAAPIDGVRGNALGDAVRAATWKTLGAIAPGIRPSAT